MALKCRCICGCKLLVSSGSAGKRIKCPKCERKLRVPVDVVEKRRAQLETRKTHPKPTAKRSKINKPLSSLVDLPDPEPPPIDLDQTESRSSEPPNDTDTTRKPPPLPQRSEHEVSRAVVPSGSGNPANKRLLAEREATLASSSDADEVAQLATDDVEFAIRGYQADRDKVATVRWLAAAIMLSGLVGMVPAIIDVVEHSLSQTSDGLSRWACTLLLVGLLQCAYVVYLVQLPDWSSVRVVTFFTLAIAASYAAMFGLTLLSGDQSHFVQLLDLADRLRGGKAAAWCLIMLSLMSLTSYFSGRVGARWRSAFVG